MKKIFPTVSSLLLVIVLLASCDNRDIRRVVKEMAEAPVDTTGFVLKTVRTNDFSVVEVDCFADVTYHQTPAGTPPYVRVRALREVLEHVSVDVRDGQCGLFVSRRYRMPDKAVVVADIYAPFVSKFILDGGKCLRLGRLDISSPLSLEVAGVGALVADSVSAPEVSVEMVGSCSTDIACVRTGRLRALLDGKCTLALKGECEESFLEYSGEARVEVSELQSRSGMRQRELKKTGR